jgi:hypothetical protein
MRKFGLVCDELKQFTQKIKEELSKLLAKLCFIFLSYSNLQGVMNILNFLAFWL